MARRPTQCPKHSSPFRKWSEEGAIKLAHQEKMAGRQERKDADGNGRDFGEGQGFLEADPNAVYLVGEKEIKGSDFPEGILPANARLKEEVK